MELRHCVVDTADEVLRSFDGSADGRAKSDGSLVTELDGVLQDAIAEKLTLSWPGIPVLGEEMSSSEQLRLAQSPSYFVLDPLDGTTNFVHGIPFYAVSVALVTHGEPRMALTYDPNRNECFTAQLGRGAWLNDHSFRCPHRPSVLKELVAVVDTKRLTPEFSARLASEHPFRSLRNFGSVALEWAWLALGRVQVYIHGGQKLWDRMPGQLIHQEAGGDYLALFHSGDVETLGAEGRLAANSPALLAELARLDFLAPHICAESIHG